MKRQDFLPQINGTKLSTMVGAHRPLLPAQAGRRDRSPASAIPLAFAIMWIFLAVSPVWAEDAGNILLNGGFEDWEAAPRGHNVTGFANEEVPCKWFAGISPDAPVETRPLVAKDEAVKHGGDYSIRLEVVDGAPIELAIRDNKWRPWPIEVNSGTRYAVRGWFKGENLEPNAKGKFIRAYVIVGEGGAFFGGDNNNQTLNHYMGELGNSDWTPFEIEFETSPTQISLWFAVSIEGSGKIWLDDMEIVPLPGKKP